MNRLSGALVALVALVLTIAVAGATAGWPGLGSRDRWSLGRHLECDRPAQRRSALDVREDEAGARQEDRLLQQHDEVLPRSAVRSAQRLQAVAEGERAGSEGHGRIRHLAERGRGAAERRDARHDRCGADGEAGAVRGPVPADGQRRSRPGADPRDRRLGSRPAARPMPAPASRSAIIDTGIDVDAPVLRRRRLLAAQLPARRPHVHEQQGHRREGVQQQVPTRRLHRRGRPGSRHARRRHGRLQLRHARRPSTACRFRTASPASRPRRCSATTTSSRARSTTRAPRTSSTRSRRPTRTAWTSST